MTSTPLHHQLEHHVLNEGHHSGRLRDRIETRGGAYAVAWGIWFTFLVTPLFFFLGTLIYLLAWPGRETNYELGQTWFIIMMVMIAAGVPFFFYLRSRLHFYGYRSGRSATPRQYIMGMTLVWSWLVLIGMLSILGCIATGDIGPNIIPALLAFIVFITQWPNASALVNRTGHLDDPSLYLHPR